MKTHQSSFKKTTSKKPLKKTSVKKTKSFGPTTIDIGDQWSHYCVLDGTGEAIEEGRIRTNAEALA
jgi:hypothetical protein